MKVYKLLDDFVFRCPYYDIEKLNELDIYSKEFEEAIYLASPSLFMEYRKHKDSESKILQTKMRLTLFKYLSRMSSRCIPFGIFAGSGTGLISNQNSKIELNKKLPITKLKSAFFGALVNKVDITELVNSDVLFYTNTTLFLLNDQFKYVERRRNPNSIDSIEVLSQTSAPDYLLEITNFCKNGASCESIKDFIISMGYVDRKEEAFEFILILIDNGLLVNELSMCVLTNDPLLRYLDIFRFRRLPEAEYKFLKNIAERLELINQMSIGERHKDLHILNTLISQHFDLDQKQLIEWTNTNLYFCSSISNINYKIKNLVAEGLKALNILTLSIPNQILQDFKSKFYMRYEYEEVSILEALDPDLGIPFANFNIGRIKDDPLIKNLPLINTNENSTNLASQLNPILLKKYHEYLVNNQDCITIEDTDLEGLYENYEGLPSSLTVSVEVITAGNTQEEPTISLKSAGGYSASNVLGRFCNDNQEILMISKKIKSIDRKDDKDYIEAEISYMPTDHAAADLLIRPLLYDYKILINYGECSENKIVLSDLFLSLDENNQLVLRSKSLNKKVVPKNTSAHIFSNSNNPMYYFLSLMQGQGNFKGRMVMDLNSLNPINGMYPRVVYNKGIILSPAKWLITKNDLLDGDNLEAKFFKLKSTRKIPNRILMIANFDNKLVLDLSKTICVELLISEIVKGHVFIEEFLFDKKDPLVTLNDKVFSNEILFNFVK